MMAKTFNRLPSEILNIEDLYVSYCLNEVAAYTIARLEKGDELQDSRKRAREYKKPSDLYNQYK